MVEAESTSLRENNGFIDENASLTLETTPPEVKRYHQQKLLLRLITLALNLALIASAALVFGPHLDALVRRWVGDTALWRLLALGFIYAAALELLSLPWDFWSEYILEHRYHLSNQTLARWFAQCVKGYLVTGPLGLVVLLGIYGLLWHGGRWWWLWAAAGWLALTVILGRIMPVLILPLFYRVTRLDNPELLQRLQRLTEGTSLTISGIFQLQLSADTRKANAALAGLGSSRRVLLSDTLLDQFTPEEIEVVFAHEVGHHVYRHLLKSVVLSVLLVLGGLWLVDVVLRYAAPVLHYPSFDDPAALPLIFLTVSLFGLVLAPLQNAISRRFERQCDRYALQRTQELGAYRSAFLKLARMNKSDVDPHPVIVWLFDDHPPIRQRLALADTIPLPRSGPA